jgi:hypothetical protein
MIAATSRGSRTSAAHSGHGVHPKAGGALYRQRAVFHPRGLAGQAHWWSVKPFHGLIFGAVARSLTRRAPDPDDEPEKAPRTTCPCAESAGVAAGKVPG